MRLLCMNACFTHCRYQNRPFHFRPVSRFQNELADGPHLGTEIPQLSGKEGSGLEVLQTSFPETVHWLMFGR